MQIGSHQVLAAEEEGGTLVLNLEAEALDAAKTMEAEAVVAVEGVGLVPKVVTKVRAFRNHLHMFSVPPLSFKRYQSVGRFTYWCRWGPWPWLKLVDTWDNAAF